jgi:endonuclease-8
MRVDHDRPFAGRTIDSVAARGKHLLMQFSGDLILHTHLRMNGAWHLYRPHARWQRKAGDMRVLVATNAVVAVAFNVPIAEFLTARDVERHRELAALGPDVLDPAFDEDEAKRRVRAQAGRPVGDVLLDQRVMAGIGNVFKSEILFEAGVAPFRFVETVSDSELDRIVAIARRLMAMNVRGATRGRRTTRSLDPAAGLWVYGRGGRPCRRCGTPIQSRKTGPDARVTYWCPRCQPESS